MFVFPLIDDYLKRIAGAEVYLAKDPQERERIAFTAYERLSLHYPESQLSPKVVALQALYMTDGASVDGDEALELQKLRKAGAKSYAIDGVSVSFGDSVGGEGIAPDVIAFFEQQERIKRSGARVGRLV